jgi:hypothetical protein
MVTILPYFLPETSTFGEKRTLPDGYGSRRDRSRRPSYKEPATFCTEHRSREDRLRIAGY